MNRRQLQAEAEQARRRAVELGEGGDGGAIGEVIELCHHNGPTVRRAAASALGKLAASEGIRDAVPSLCQLTSDEHPQVRQYALLALGKIGDESALPMLRDAANRPTGPDYVLCAALRAIEQIETAARKRAEFGPVACSRCGRAATFDERQLSSEYWGLDTTDYKIGMLLKQKLYQQEGKRLISLYPADLAQLDSKLSAALQ